MVKGKGSLVSVEADLDELARIERLIGLGAHPERLPRRPPTRRPARSAAASISRSISMP